MAELLASGELVTATVVTLRRMAVGFVLAVIPAIAIGLAMGVSRTTRLVFSPLISALYPVPKIALVPMVVILFGLGETSKYAIVAISVFFLVAINTMAGVMNIEDRYFDIAAQQRRTWMGADLDRGGARLVAKHADGHQPGAGLCADRDRGHGVAAAPGRHRRTDLDKLLSLRSSNDIRRADRRGPAWMGVYDTHGRSRTPVASLARLESRKAPQRRLEDEPRVRRFVRTWWMASRPFSLTAAIVPVVLGSVLAAYRGRVELAAVCHHADRVDLDPDRHEPDQRLL